MWDPAEFESPMEVILKKMDREMEGNEENIIIPISCGQVNGDLYLNHFKCPGIHVPCILVNGTLCTPKHLITMAGKGKQKDWKASIRLHSYGSRTLRYLMDAKQIDFSDHDEFCTQRCQNDHFYGPNQMEYFQKYFEANRDVSTTPTFTSGHNVNFRANATASSKLPTSFYLLSPSNGMAPIDITEEYIKSLMTADPIKLVAEIHHIGLLPRVLANLKDTLERTDQEEPLPSNFLRSFAPALCHALTTFNLCGEVSELIREKQVAYAEALSRVRINKNPAVTSEIYSALQNLVRRFEG